MSDTPGSPSSSSKLPSHPTARAFFDALDGKGTQKKASTAADSKGTKKTTSAFIQKRISLLGWRNRHSQDNFYPVSIKGAKFSVRQIQRGELEGKGTGATVWPAALVLLKYLERTPAVLQGKNVVDLGSGTGVTSIGCAILGAKHVVCTDGMGEVVQLAKENIVLASSEIANNTETNHETSTSPNDNSPADADNNRAEPIAICGCIINTQELWWGRDTVQAFGARDTDVVLVADCVLPKLYPIAPLVQAIDELLAKESAIALLSYEHRYYPEYDPRDKFRALATEKGLNVETIPIEEHDPVYSAEDIELWKVTRKQT